MGSLGEGENEGSIPVLFRTSRPGSGGISRGRGDAPLSFGDAGERESEFAAQALPSARFAESSTQNVGVATGAPRVAPVESTPAAGGNDSAAGAPSAERRIAPRHRDAVRRFFSPTPKKSN